MSRFDINLPILNPSSPTIMSSRVAGSQSQRASPTKQLTADMALTTRSFQKFSQKPSIPLYESVKVGDAFLQQTFSGNKEFGPYCFAELKTAPKPLPKLYTQFQHQLISSKMNFMKEKCQTICNRTNNMVEEIQTKEKDQNSLKELFIEAEKIFRKSYSVKYFGVHNDNQLGVTSKRVSMDDPEAGPSCKCKANSCT